MDFLKLVFPTFIATFIFGGIASAQDDDIIWIDYPEEGAVLGQGYDLLNGRVTLGRCVDFVPVQDPSQVITYKFEEVNSTTEVVSKTQISASGSMKMAIVKASARLSFLSDEKFTLNTSKFLLSAEVTNSALFAAPALGLKKGANIAVPFAASKEQPNINHLTPYLGKFSVAPRGNEPTVFKDVKLCGQGYVAAIVSGAAVDAFLTMSKSNAEALADIKGGLEADIAGVFKVSGSFEQQQSSKEVQDSTSVSVFRYGGATGDIAYDLPSLKESLKSLVTDAASQPKPVRIGIVPYKRISTDLIRTIKADDYSEAISAYFLAKDIMGRTSQTLTVLGEVPPQPGEQRVPGRRPIYYLKDLMQYDELFTKAQRHASRVSTMLSFCRQDSAETNDAQNDTPDVAAVVKRTFSSSEGDDAAAIFGARSTGSLVTDENAQKFSGDDLDEESLGKVFEENMKVLKQPLPGKDDTEFATEVELRLKACRQSYDSDKSTGSYLSVAGQYSVKLLQDELQLRPLYWGELGQRYRELVAGALDKKAVTEGTSVEELTTNQISSVTKTYFEEYHVLFRASQARRDICVSDLTHPVCLTDTEWSKKSVPDYGLIEFDAQQLLRETGSEPK